jgi:ABC-2 type transport system ATP-binding protein
LQHTVEVSDRIVAMHKGEVVKDIQTSPETLKELELFFCGLNINGNRKR